MAIPLTGLVNSVHFVIAARNVTFHCMHQPHCDTCTRSCCTHSLCSHTISLPTSHHTQMVFNLQQCLPGSWLVITVVCV
ncbi:hypothetical protein EB796_025124 [Bugula neritina]|uniref:Uncharacterized protein n=1 Tax=Bugula neritina TaxID=10212 RepID=A0A7J7IRQ3_BUGNE|nr:hypothetical protein EB796_025124 [Bugula neritina]